MLNLQGPSYTRIRTLFSKKKAFPENISNGYRSLVKLELRYISPVNCGR
jgi:hypothetical protein